MPRIFISYRRDDSAGYVGRLYDKVKEQFGESSVFMDIDAILPGEDFVEVIEKAVTSCDVLLAVLGKQWLTITDASGNRRIDNPNDFVRLEIAAALRRNVRVIPVLVRGAAMPSAAQLPADLQLLSRRNAHAVSDKNFHRDVDDLIKILGQIKTRKFPLQRLAALLIVFVLAFAGYLVATNLSDGDSPSERPAGVIDTATPEPAQSDIQPISGMWEFTYRPDDTEACGEQAGQIVTERQILGYEIAEDGDLLIRYVGEEGTPGEFWRVAPNVYLQGEYDGFFIELRVIAPDHLEEVFSHPSETYGVPPETVPEDPYCRGMFDYILIEPF